MPIGSVIDLVSEIVRLQVLTSSQRTELDTTLAPTLLDPKKLAAELIRRNWLTPFQINYLFAGRTNELMLGPYVLLQRLGEGGMGQVYKAMHTVLRRVDAVKTVRFGVQSADTRALTDRFRQEAIAAGRVSHRNLVAVHTAEARGDTFFLAMELLEGTDLGRMIAGSPAGLPVSQACDLIRQTALGLQAAHTAGLIHRDIKPSNLMLLPDGTVKVLDLGLACVRRTGEDDSRLTRPGAMMGTPDYMPPEQFSDAYAVDERADIYALGCTLYHLLTGKPPFPDGSIFEKMRHHCDHEPVPLREKRADVPPEVASLVHAMMAKDPGKRPQTAGAVATALSLFSGGSTTVPVARPVEEVKPPVAIALPQTSHPVASLAPPQSAIQTEPAMSDQTLIGPPGSERTVPFRSDPSRKKVVVFAGGALGALLLIALLLIVFRSKPEPKPDDTGSKPDDKMAAKDKKRKPEVEKPTIIVDQKAGPIKTIREALTMAQDGMRIRIRPGKYEEANVVRRSVELVGDGEAGDITLVSDSADTLVVFGEQVELRRLTIRCASTLNNPHYAVDAPSGHVLIEECRLSSNSLAPVGVHGDKGLRATMRDCTIYESEAQGGVLVIEKAELLMEDCELFNTKLAALETRDTAKATGRNCKFRDGKGMGVLASAESEITLEKCEINANGGPGVIIQDDGKMKLTACTFRDAKSVGMLIKSSQVVVENCELVGGKLAQVQIEGGSEPTLRNCRIHDGAIGGIVWTRNGKGKAEDCEIWGHGQAEVRMEIEANPQLVRCKLFKSKGTGASVSKKSTGRFEDCEIHSNAKPGIEIINEARPTLTRTKIYSGKEDGIKVWNNGHVTLDRCEVTANQNAGVSIGPAGTATIRGGSVTNNGASGIVVDSGGTADVVGCDLRKNALKSWEIRGMTNVTRRNNQEE